MAKWMREWFALSFSLILVLGMFLILWVIWPLLPGRLSPQLFTSLNTEGIFAILMLITVATGFLKLVFGGK